MSNHNFGRRAAFALLPVVLTVAAGGILSSCKQTSLPSADSPTYEKMVSEFYSGLLAMNVGDDNRAAANLKTATETVPQEPAAWANLGLYQLRKNNAAEAKGLLEQAHTLAPESGEIENFLGLLSKSSGQYADAITHFQNAIKADPNDFHARYALVQVIQQQAGPDADKQVQEQLEAIHKALPNNTYIQIELGQLAAKAGNTALLKELIGSIQPRPSWSPEARARLETARADVAKSDLRQVVTDLSFLRNVIVPTAEYQRDQNAVQEAAGKSGVPIDHFLKLPSPSPKPAAPDTALTLAPQPIAAPAGDWTWARSAFLAADAPASLIVANGHTVQIAPPSKSACTLPFPGGAVAKPPTLDGILPVDWNNEFNLGLVLAGQGGVRIFRQKAGATPFVDATAGAKLPAAVTNAAYTGVWAADVDSDGDLDLILGSATGAPTVLRNNADGTFTVMHPFPGATDGLVQFVWADLNGDGDADAAFIDGTGRVRFFENQRGGMFKEGATVTFPGKMIALTVADTARDGKFRLVVLDADGVITSLTKGADGWQSASLAKWSAPPTDGSARLSWADLDNNGGLDLVASGSGGSMVWLSDPQGALQPLPAVTGKLLSVDEQDNHGRLDLVGLSPDGKVTRIANKGTKEYAWQQIRLRSKLTSDHRNNAFGIGSLIELRAGLVYAEQMVTRPVTHFGLGTATTTSAVRIQWPNGAPQGEFELKPDQVADAPERLIGSCPWLFAWDGHRMNFVTDFLWRSALGLRINAQNTAGVVMTGDWNKIRSDQLVARNGYYDFRLTTQLWESYFFDQIQLMTVDHPADTDIWVDERFSIPPPELAYRVMSKPQPLSAAHDDLGNDVTRLVGTQDEQYVDTFGRGAYQGITRDHWIELDLGAAPAQAGNNWLLCNGWLHPTDSSINLAISQGRHPAPSAIRVEVPDGHGGWRVAKANFGFPEGKFKTMLVPLDGLFAPGAPRRLRLRTNLEIYWDWIASATELPQTPTRSQRIDPAVADLKYHGFNVIRQANLSSPEVPIYDAVAQTTQRWQDMEGFYTRFGDVRPLLTTVDDRYIIMNAGDELEMHFTAPAAPPAGWKRDFVLIGDGWGKDCNHNSGFSKTVLPLPYHGDRVYNRIPTRLEDEPAYKAHREDWATYHTRYVTPQGFQSAMRP